jgi:hypothetical protein
MYPQYAEQRDALLEDARLDDVYVMDEQEWDKILADLGKGS